MKDKVLHLAYICIFCDADAFVSVPCPKKKGCKNVIVKCEEFVEEGHYEHGHACVRCIGPELTGTEAERHEAHLTDGNRLAWPRC